MKLKLVAVAFAGLALITGCAANETTPPASDGPETSAASNQLSGALAGGGASSQTAAQEAWRAGFQALHGQVTINYDPTGSGTGRTNFADGGYLFAGSDAPFSVADAQGDFAACAAGSDLVEIPAYISPIAVAFNLDGITSLDFDAATVAAIFSGAITTWNDPAIAALNPGASLPDSAITPVHRSDKSGTTENFTDYLSQAAAASWTWPAAEEWPAELTGEAAEKTQGVRQTLSTTVGAIGYLDASQAGELGTARIQVGDDFVAISAAAAAAAVGQSQLEAGRAATDVVVKLDRVPTSGQVYPVVLISYLVACQQYADAAAGELVRAFFEYVVSPAGQAAAASNAGSAPLTEDATLEPLVTAAVAAIG
ncbi:MAG: phosphate ABC transporter substrate-binding protein PstS [Propionibacteriaceae bacterium]|jgi:phosphate transport system substrate-binding protein|nr:phosphate ABC transporter substrate-binding protein PstS [Propionibacteriaceae bacterium]